MGKAENEEIRALSDEVMKQVTGGAAPHGKDVIEAREDPVIDVIEAKNDPWQVRMK